MRGRSENGLPSQSERRHEPPGDRHDSRALLFVPERAPDGGTDRRRRHRPQVPDHPLPLGSIFGRRTSLRRAGGGPWRDTRRGGSASSMRSSRPRGGSEVERDLRSGCRRMTPGCGDRSKRLPSRSPRRTPVDEGQAPAAKSRFLGRAYGEPSTPCSRFDATRGRKSPPHLASPTALHVRAVLSHASTPKRSYVAEHKEERCR